MNSISDYIFRNYKELNYIGQMLKNIKGGCSLTLRGKFSIIDILAFSDRG